LLYIHPPIHSYIHLCIPMHTYIHALALALALAQALLEALADDDMEAFEKAVVKFNTMAAMKKWYSPTTNTCISIFFLLIYLAKILVRVCLLCFVADLSGCLVFLWCVHCERDANRQTDLLLKIKRLLAAAPDGVEISLM
jgi:hypothetical protein